MEDQFGIVIQARTNSSRFPNKIVKSLDNDITFLDVLLSRLTDLKREYKVVVATTDSVADDIIQEISEKHDVDVFRGDEQNVLKRFIECSQKFEFSKIVRVCSDNPYIDLGLLSEMIGKYKGEDYFSFKVNGIPSILTHFGFFCEIVSISALLKVAEFGKLECIEHVTNCVYTNQDVFSVNFIEIDIFNTNVRCTLDTEFDFKVLKEIYFNYYLKNQNIEYKKLIEFVENNAQLMEVMKSQIKQNTK